MMPDHICSQIPFIVYAYDQNGKMTSRTVDGVEWAYTYSADGQLTQTRKNNQLVSEYGYNGDGKRVWSKDYEGYPAGELKETIYIGNYYEFVTEVLTPEPGAGGVCTGTYCTDPGHRKDGKRFCHPEERRILTCIRQDSSLRSE